MNLSTITETTMTSWELSEVSGRRHDSIIRSIESLNVDLKGLSKPQAVETSKTSECGTKEVIGFILTKYQCELLAMRLDTKTQIKVLDKLKELEGVSKPKTVLELLEASVTEIKRLGQENLTLVSKIEEDKPKVSYANAVSGSVNPCAIREWVNSLKSDQGLKVGERKVISFLEERKYLYRDAKKNLRAYSKYTESSDKNFFSLVPLTVATPKGNIEKFHLRVTGPGQLMLGKVVLDNFKEDTCTSSS